MSNKSSILNDYYKYTSDYKKEYGENTVVFMQVGSFYEIYGIKDNDNDTAFTGSNINHVSQICDFKIAHKQATYKNKGTVMVGFPIYQLDKFVKKMQDAFYTIVVFKQDENISKTTRSLLGIFSPGTFFNDDSNQLSNSVSCVWIDSINISHHIIGLSNTDIISGTSILYEYHEYTDKPTFDQIEHFISLHNPNEVIFIHSHNSNFINKLIKFSDSYNRTNHIIDLNNTDNVNTSRANNCDKQTYQSEIFNKFFPCFKFEHSLFQYTIAIQSYTFLLDWIWRHNPNLVRNIKPPIFENHIQTMHIANHSLKQLNIINDHNVLHSSRNSSITNLLNLCVTAMGKRHTFYAITHPSTDPIFLTNSYDLTEYIYNSIDYTSLRKQISGIKDTEKLTRKFYLKQLVPTDVFNLYNDFLNCLSIFENICSDKKLHSYFKNLKNFEYKSFINNLNIYIQLISSILDIDKCQNINTIDIDFNIIKSGYSSNHDKLVDLYNYTENDISSIQSVLNTIISKNESKKNNKTDFIGISNNDKYGINLFATKRRVSILLTNIKSSTPQCITLQSIQEHLDYDNIVAEPASCASNSNITSPQIKILCKNVYTSKNNMISSQTNIFNKLIDDLAEKSHILQQFSLFIANLDFILNIPYVSQKYNLHKPTITGDSPFINTTKLRHPLIENCLNDELYVSNDIIFDSNYKGYLLYGTNAVGKSSFIKSIGIALIMAQSGFYVPSSSFSFFPYKKIFTRILGNDNIFKGLSTFAVEMLEFKNILEQSCENSLILGDELCSGTETDSATSIIIAGLNHLHSKSSSYIFATHFHEIVNYDEITSKSNLHIKHMSMAYDHSNDTLIYNRTIADGPGESMYGLEVCKSLHLPKDFLVDAHEIRNKYNKKGESILDYTTSRYNSKKLRGGLCEFCNKRPVDEVHHMVYQDDADSNGIIQNDFHKNHIANLMNICTFCHDELHKLQKRIVKKKSIDGKQSFQTI
jgi:DNA mismatch repair protein MutS